MRLEELKQALAEIDNNHKAMQKQLSDFAPTDMLFFFSDKPELYRLQQQKWQPILDWAKGILQTELKTTQSLQVPDNNGLSDSLLKIENKLNKKQFCAWYAAALNMRSVILGLALVMGKITAQEASELAGLEELWQNEQWGEDKLAVEARQRKADELKLIEEFNLSCAM